MRCAKKELSKKSVPKLFDLITVRYNFRAFLLYSNMAEMTVLRLYCSVSVF
uniref:Uncharacterized protein n=1 Tax=Podoviridae sp. ctARy1 TaxID=2825228 RepID=A0A8S5TSM0_9CAUD|nr:MAG TPA: hypothetical protein [Podoviridae sp. ctARy1]